MHKFKKEKKINACLPSWSKTSPTKFCIQFKVGIKLRLFLTLDIYVCVLCVFVHTHIYMKYM